MTFNFIENLNAKKCTYSKIQPYYIIIPSVQNKE